MVVTIDVDCTYYNNFKNTKELSNDRGFTVVIGPKRRPKVDGRINGRDKQ